MSSKAIFFVVVSERIKLRPSKKKPYQLFTIERSYFLLYIYKYRVITKNCVYLVICFTTRVHVY